MMKIQKNPTSYSACYCENLVNMERVNDNNNNNNNMIIVLQFL